MSRNIVAQLNLSTAIRQGLQCRTGQEFQETVQRILRNRLPGFQPIIPHGRDGDGGNDGYCRKRGIYTQVYAPISSILPGRQAARKVLDDFLKIKNTWNNISDIKEYWFVTNSPASNIHIETALSEIERKHNIKARFLGSDELADEVARMPQERIEALMGFTVRAGLQAGKAKSATLEFLASVSSEHLKGLHALAALVHPVTPKLCEELLPKITDWKSFWPWLFNRKWATRVNGQVVLDKKVADRCRRNMGDRRLACEQLVKPLVEYGSIDCLYLSITPLVVLGRLAEAGAVVTRAGLDFEKTDWDRPISELAEFFNTPKILRALRRADRCAFQIARAALLSRTGQDQKALAVYDSCLKISAWPKTVSRGQIMINCGVVAYRTGDEQRARLQYERAIAWARRHRDDWTFGRAATNLAQMLLHSDHNRAEALIAEAEAAKYRCGDVVGMIAIETARGHLAAQQACCPQAAYEHFKLAERMAQATGQVDVLPDVYFNLGRSSGELTKWRRAMGNYRRSLSHAIQLRDLYREARARVGLAETTFHLSEWAACKKECQKLAALPHNAAWSDIRLTGLHGMYVLQLRTGKTEDAKKLLLGALTFAKKHGQQEWIGRLLVDSLLVHRGTAASPDEIEVLLDAGKAEQKAGRCVAAAWVYSNVLHSLVRQGVSPELRDRAESLLSRIIDNGLELKVALEHLGQQCGLFLESGHPWKALDKLAQRAALAKASSLWEDYVRSIDQQGFVLQSLDCLELAEPLHREALRVASRYRLIECKRVSAANLAECYRRLGRAKDAHKTSLQALRLQDVHQDSAGYVSVLHNHYLIERALGRTSARRTLKQCERLAREYGLISETIRAVMAQGHEAWDKHNWARAATCFKRAFNLAEEARIREAADDCRYNLALLFRKTGRKRAALRVLFDRSRRGPLDMHEMHRTSLKALLLEDTGQLMRARKTWKEAASIAKTIRQPSQETYFRTRDELIRDLPGSNTSSRQALADRADELLLALYGAPGRDSEIQQRFDAAKSFFDQHSLPHYQVHVFQAVADRLTERGHAGDLIEAAQASMASILTAVSHKNWVVSAMETHVAWLVNLGLKGAQLLRLRNKTRVWLSRQLQQLGSIGQFEYLLVGFDTAIELANTEIQRFKDSQNSARF